MRRHRRKFTGRTKADVLEKMRDARRATDDGVPLGAARDTVGALLVDFLARGLPSTAKAPKTIEGYHGAVVDHLVPQLGARKLRELTPDDVESMLRAKAAAGLSRATLVHIHGVLTRALRWAEGRGRVGRNVSALANTPQGHRRTSKAMTIEQARALLSAARTDRLEALWTLGLTVPSRPGELTGLSWADVDLEEGIVHFRQALHHGPGGALTLGPLKTEQSRRSVEVPAVVVAALHRRKAAQAREQLTAGSGWTDTDLVFTTGVGTPVDPSHLRRNLRALALRAGLPGVWTVYELRHSAVSILSAAGVPIEQIAYTAGHRNSRVPASVYRHNLSPVISSARGPMDQVFSTSQ